MASQRVFRRAELEIFHIVGGSIPPALVTLLSPALVALTIEIDNAFELGMPHRTTDYGASAGKRHPPLDLDVSTQDNLALFTLLSRALLMFAMDYEGESSVSLAIGANVLRVLDKTGVRLRDLPRVSGVSNASISAALGFLQRSGAVAIERDATATRGQTVRLTSAGRAARSDYHRRIVVIEADWHRRYGD